MAILQKVLQQEMEKEQNIMMTSIENWFTIDLAHIFLTI